ncbi:UBX domain-containing protein 4 [Prunus yedoensis var. nudiflora]|uniref:UBX domain-containing protein 4 n=1 Tax=Prunus yedoensis var. nudiflora TaxID=2094558 RepID=A0A314XU76_PRUYE|nr:UBX domain-containing protein 4 [Prunus yedoensis var. nudiflora]
MESTCKIDKQKGGGDLGCHQKILQLQNLLHLLWKRKRHELSSLPIRPATKTEQMRECLRSLKQNHKEDDAKVKRAFQTLLTFVGNVARNPDEEKYRKIRLTNQSFQDRVGSFKGGIEFLELCEFERVEGSEFLFLPRDKVDMAVLNSAGSELDSAIKNPFFGVL